MSNQFEMDRFLSFCGAMGLSGNRIRKYRRILRWLSERLNKGFRATDREDIVRVVSWIEQSGLSDWTKHDYKVTVKRFFKWLEGEDEDYPKKVRWIRTGSKKIRARFPSEMLSREEMYSLIAAGINPEIKLLLGCLWETGCRISELLEIRIKQASFDRWGARIMLVGTTGSKTGVRPVRVFDHAELLKRFITNRNNDSLVFNKSYNTYREMMLDSFHRTGINKNVTFHVFRHSRATYLANYLNEFQMCEYFGWVQGSDMPRVYVHLSGANVDRALIRVHCLEHQKLVECQNFESLIDVGSFIS